MESHARPLDTTTSSCSSNYSSTNGPAQAEAFPSSLSSPSQPTLPPPPTPLTPKSIPRACEANPYPTTFVHADSASFKQVVQILTGSAETAAAAANSAAPKTPPVAPAARATGPKKPAFKLYERRNSLKNLKIISPLIPTFFNSSPNSPAGASAFSPRMQPEILSPSMLDFPSLALSPVTPLIPDPFNRLPHPNSEAGKLAEYRAIAEKGFYLHPSPRTTPREADPPQLLPLFPVTSPMASSDSSLPELSPSSP